MTIMDALNFTDAEIPQDSTPVTSDVEYPCRKCNKEAGPYSGRGRKPVYCPECRGSAKKSGPRVTGGANNLAAQAAETLVQLNTFLAMGAMAMGLIETGMSIQSAQEMFRERAHAALLTDPEFCRSILRTGAKSAKFSLSMAYVGMGMTVGPTAVMEIKERKAARMAEKAAQEAEAVATGY